MESRILYIPHGGGPLPLMNHGGHKDLTAFLSGLVKGQAKPTGILVISAHWERDIPVITSGPAPHLIYDYFGFPEAAYQISYPAPGSPALARQAADLLTANRISTRLDPDRGFDHGMFIPLALMLPDADVPCIQISLCADLDPTAHLSVGEALSPLLKENIWVLGSGFSFHNMGAFDLSGAGDLPADEDDNRAFQAWLDQTCTGPGLTPKERKDRLVRWENAPHARFCHPREEHLLPLMVCAGMAGCRPAERIFDKAIMGRQALAFSWEGLDAHLGH